MIKENKLELNFELFIRKYSKGELPFLKRWKKNDLFLKKLKSLEDIEEQMKRYQKQKYPSDCYEVLKKVEEKKGAIIYDFVVIPGHKSDAIKYNYPNSYIQRKVVPRLKIKGKK